MAPEPLDPPAALPSPIVAAAADLEPDIARALEHPVPPRRTTVDAAGLAFALAAWGEPGLPVVLLLHGVVSSSGTWWRLGPALAATGRHVLAPDLPGHGLTGSWNGHHAPAAVAADIVALARALDQDPGRLQVVGHSWGATIAAAVPAAGLRPTTLVLLDPPALPRGAMAAMLDDPTEQHQADLATALELVRRTYPSWSAGDVEAKAISLTRTDPEAARAVLSDNGDWDGGLASLADPAASTVPTWIVRGEPASGGMLPDEALPGFAARIGAARILTIAGGPHSPQRTHPEATLVAILRALDDPRS